MSFTPEIIVVVVVGGLVCGFLNTVASSGSAVTLPILMAIGLPAAAANATNRVPVLVGAMAATVGLARHGAMLLTTSAAMLVFVTHQSVEWGIGGLMGIGALFGGLLGARVAVSEHARRWIVGLLVVVIVGELIHLAVPLHWLDKEIRPAIDVFSAVYPAALQTVARLRV
ncbi:TSUP family transporter [Paraburkholderia rhizosphaerae]|uniref:Sulfite exporter TauE/SafE n=1 Tax=Paraburkholderia rhizosphaerae TaxID=480658 RepID=A0A4R8LLB4_9BURK|nr:TSUP family transporter [Paraburkholderia rhizosphaerae]TDY43300.1 sulfite exporter TauE/SafE [Paraburkholderia rhizosphaerae]